MRRTSKTLVAARFGIVVASLAAALVLAELSLRIFRPDLSDLVHSVMEPNRYRIHRNPRGSFEPRGYPDGGREKHWVVHNSLGFRQHREFARKKPPGVIRVGVFGDSFVENLRIPVEYSFTEPLDFLLNETGGTWEVLNFGTDGYGTDQIYLQYLDDAIPLDLDVVLYVFCPNDLMDVIADRLIDVDPRGELRYLPVRKTRPIVEVMKHFYLTYFLMESSSILEERFARVLRPRYDRRSIVDMDEEARIRRVVAQRK